VQKIPVARLTVATRRNAQLCWRLQPLLRSAISWGDRRRSGPCEKHMTAKRTYVLAAEEDAWQDDMNALFEFLTTEPAICPAA